MDQNSPSKQLLCVTGGRTGRTDRARGCMGGVAPGVLLRGVAAKTFSVGPHACRHGIQEEGVSWFRHAEWGEEDVGDGGAGSCKKTVRNNLGQSP